MALYFQPFIRHLIAGHVPLFAFDAPVFGSGKTLAARAALMPVVTLFGSFAYVNEQEEIRKALTSSLLEGRPVIMIDNATGLIDNPVLAKVLTDDYHSDRLLGGNQTATLPVRAIFVMTGNNLSFARDLPRRVVPSRLDTGLERPFERKPNVFKKPDLLKWVRNNRAALIHAGLTVMAGWFAKGAKRSEKSLGSYEEWAGITGGILEFINIPDFLDNLSAFYADTDSETNLWTAFVTSWGKRVANLEPSNLEGLTAAQLLPAALEAGLSFKGKDDEAKAKSFGWALRRMRGRRFGDFKVHRESRTNHPMAPGESLTLHLSPAPFLHLFCTFFKTKGAAFRLTLPRTWGMSAPFAPFGLPSCARAHARGRCAENGQKGAGLQKPPLPQRLCVHLFQNEKGANRAFCPVLDPELPCGATPKEKTRGMTENDAVERLLVLNPPRIRDAGARRRRRNSWT